MKPTIEERICDVVSDIFGIPIEVVNEGTNPDNVEEWDSVGHIKLILALEAEFGLSLSPKDAMDMLSIRLIRMILEERGVTNSSSSQDSGAPPAN